ncbi:MAG TPA: hypothetical protein VGN11_13060 [Candidatus Baltobacteraceae bacterium]|nr:hypothetical protein [Candidatus Baltobacteraceae bacterium]
MGVLLEIHTVVAFLVVLCAVVFSWNDLGRRVVNAVAGLQFLLGLALAATMGASHMGMPPQLWLHLLCAILILAAYGLAMRFGKRAGGARTALALSVAGIVLVFVTFYLGLQMAGKV